MTGQANLGTPRTHYAILSLTRDAVRVYRRRMPALRDLRDARWTLDELVETANRLLPEHLPDAPREGRFRDEVNPRLVRHYATQRLLDEPEREGREARYTYRHLLQLLALRKLMAQGYGTAALADLTGRTDAELEGLLEGGARLAVAPNPALAQLERIRERAVLGSLAEPDMPAFSIGPDSMSEARPAPRSPLPPAPRWTRLDVAPGIELHVSEHARIPDSPAEREPLLRIVERHLKALLHR